MTVASLTDYLPLLVFLIVFVIILLAETEDTIGSAAFAALFISAILYYVLF